ncbi:MAG: SURF1 family protein [Alphaproteobacteria bacterium]|nr:SURF1 family protein [Alphaproteobacteria bacterium]
MPFRPALIPTLFVAVGLVILVNLGMWQLRRHHAAGALRDEVHARLYGDPATNADLSDGADSLGWRKAVLTGTYTDDGPFLVAGRFEFGNPGFDVLQVLDTGDHRVLVNRGWIPSEGWQDTLAAIRTDGDVQVEGLLVALTGNADIRPLPASDGHPERWPQETSSVGGCTTGVVGPPYAAIAAQVPGLVPVLVVVGPELTRGQLKARAPLPVGGYVAEPKRIGHLEYAVQWFLIALTLLGTWVYAGVRRARRLAATGT